MSSLLLEVRVSNSPEVLGQQAADATRLMQGGDHAGAQKIYKQVLAAMPKHPSTWSNLAALAVGLGDAKAARSHALRAFYFDPHHVDAGVNYGVASWHANQRRDAERAFRHALSLSPGLEAPALNLMQMWHGITRYDLASEMLDAALLHNPGSSRLQQARAENARLCGDADIGRRHALGALSLLLRTLAPQETTPVPPVEQAELEAGRERMRTSMQETSDRLVAAGIEYYLIGAVVLGITREGQPFHGDKDLDIVLPTFTDRARLVDLFAEGYSRMRIPQHLEADSRCMGWIHDATGIGVDIYFHETSPEGLCRQCLGWPDYLVYDYPPHAIGTLHWSGRDWPAPAPIADYLASKYGDDWLSARRAVGDHSFDKRWFDTQISCPGLVAESIPAAINLGLLRLLVALRQQRWEKALALCDQLLERQEISEVEATRTRLLAPEIH